MLVLAESQEFDGDTLRLAVAATSAGRNTTVPVECPLALTSEFSDTSQKKTQRNASGRRARRPDLQELSRVIDTLARFLWRVLQAAARDEPWPFMWSAGGPWKPRP